MILVKCDNMKCAVIEQVNEIYENSNCFFCQGIGKLRLLRRIK